MNKQSIINWFKEFTGAPEIDLVDDLVLYLFMI